MKQTIALTVFILYMPAYVLLAESNIPAPYVGNQLNGLPCNGEPRGYGPFDYFKRSSIDPYNLKIVEGEHFTPNVENLIKGKTGDLWNDLDYTLRAWPNHHRALLSIIRYELSAKKKLKPYGPKIPPECYLQRAIHFSPEDPTPYALYGHYLRKLDKLTEADGQYQKAVERAPENAKIAYSYSLLLIDLKNYEKALIFAKKVYSLNKNAPQSLRHKLTKLGVWKE